MYSVIFAPSTKVHSLCLNDDPIPIWWKEPSAELIKRVNENYGGIKLYDTIPQFVRAVFEPMYSDRYNFDEIEIAIAEHLKTFTLP